ncbi:hypothetical protein D9M72_155280 [compost metagenome]
MLLKFGSNIEPRLDLLLVKDRLERVQRIRSRVPIQRRDRLRRRHPRQVLLRDFVADHDRPAADRAVRGRTALAAGRRDCRHAHAQAAWRLRHAGARYSLRAAGHVTLGVRAQAAVLAAGSTPVVSAADPDLAGFVAGVVLEVLGDQRAGGQLVQTIGHRLVAAGDDAADERGVVLDVDDEAAVSGLQACLLRGGLEVALHLALRHVGRYAA